MASPARNFAEALFELTYDVPEPEAMKAADRLIELLRRESRLSLLPAIVREYERLVHTAQKGRQLTVKVAKESDRRALADAIERDAAQLGTHEREEVIVDASLVGGYILEANGQRVDQSYKSRLLALYRELAGAA